MFRKTDNRNTHTPSHYPPNVSLIEMRKNFLSLEGSKQGGKSPTAAEVFRNEAIDLMILCKAMLHYKCSANIAC